VDCVFGEPDGKNRNLCNHFSEGQGTLAGDDDGRRLAEVRHDGLALFYVGSNGVIKSTDVNVMQRQLSPGGLEALFDAFPDAQQFMIGSVREEKLHSPLTLITNWTAELKRK
jgi:hypothetical protein